MRYAKRMLLIPEDVYKYLMAFSGDSSAAGLLQNNRLTDGPMGNALTHATQRLATVRDSKGPEMAMMNDDERLLHKNSNDTTNCWKRKGSAPQRCILTICPALPPTHS